MSEETLTRLFNSETAVQAILWLAALSVLLGFVVKLWPVVSKFVATVNALSDLPEKLRLLDEVHHEVRPNTGTSLNDSVRRTERRVAEIDSRLGRVEGQMDAQSEQIDGLQSLMESADAEIAERVDDLENTVNPRREK